MMRPTESRTVATLRDTLLPKLLNSDLSLAFTNQTRQCEIKTTSQTGKKQIS
jgi:hypothetical protein